MKPLAQQVDAAVREHDLLQKGQKVLVGVSGGVDSMVLLNVLQRLSESFGWKLHVAHFNHQLRGRSSDADEKLVRRAAQRFVLPISVQGSDVRKFARAQKISIEMAARQLRHESLARVAREHQIQTIALAHHVDDQVELFFVRLLRGAGPEGLAGMDWSGQSPADPNLRLIRPLLDCSKQQLLEYARSEKIQFREDQTNQSLDILRNRIRHELLPLLRKRYQPALEKTMLRLMAILRSESALVDGIDPLTLALSPRGERENSPEFSQLPIALQRRLLHKRLIELGLRPNFDLIEELRHVADTPVMIAPDTVLKRDASGQVILERVSGSSFNGEAVVVALSENAGALSFGGLEVEWKMDAMPKGPFKPPKSRPGGESFDADKVGSAIVLRHWQPGDRFQPIGMAKAVKLQDLFINQKVLRAKRHKLLLAATTAGDILWVEGFRISERFKLDSHSLRQLKWCWRRQ